MNFRTLEIEKMALRLIDEYCIIYAEYLRIQHERR